MEKTPTQQNLSKIGIKPLKPNLRPYEYSNDVAIPPLSFYDPKSLEEKGELKKKEIPITPCYLPLTFLNRPRQLTPNTIFKDFSIEKDGDLKLIDKNLLERQKGILAYVIKKAAGKLLEGKSIVGLSLPVRIFEPRSILERLSDLWTFAPHYLTRAAAEDGVERLKYAFAFLMSALPLATSQWKPFNPLLGETFQGELPDGTTIDCEQTSHHPPIASFYVVNKNWKAYGSQTINGNLRGNSFNAYNEGWMTIEFNDGHKLKFYTPAMSLKGMLMGKRKCQYIASVCVKDEHNKLKAVVKLNADARSTIVSMFKSSRQDTMKGMIYSYNEKANKKILSNKKWYDMLKAQGEMTDIEKCILKIDGSWLNSIQVNKKQIFNLGEDLKFATPPRYREICLPSDGRFREDLIWLSCANEAQSQIWKVLLEEQQRKDRKLRKKEKEKKQKKRGKKM